MFFKKHDKPHITVALIGVTVMLFMICPSCKKEKTDTIANFADRKAVPAMYVDSVTTLISDSGRIRYKVIAQTWKVFDQADEPYWYFPEGVYFERFNDSLEVESIVRGDTARYFTEQELWELKNDVLVKNLSGEQFETNLLYWSQQKHKVYSDSFIRIQQADQILTGYGFESNESLSKYKIFKIKGVFPLDVEEDGLNNPE
ncbi:MAG: LPS export ABC transporter periplasmic protein LptC [Bacteroidales bacterium]|nr:LPS export ABC transporter periplasmic protein LptC [Bacteroidales bacterium]MBO5768747.1 LPS export ABC transporter periplasmic protein LptC [Bacteroidales bacterium]MBO5819201.1 LPS export ABC transporter periplasmic protein LptC [Bacteroidales bacterium]MBO5835318.1 LPS export ABC transporter periplasmic protein LptC [Bacteroidales bacterium]MBO5847134.1 LPS export ABC transporter periplasmic protein LptC [Bacteroidales bacterium]